MRIGHLSVTAQTFPGDVLVAGDFNIIRPEDVARQRRYDATMSRRGSFWKFPCPGCQSSRIHAGIPQIASWVSRLSLNSFPTAKRRPSIPLVAEQVRENVQSSAVT